MAISPFKAPVKVLLRSRSEILSPSNSLLNLLWKRIKFGNWQSSDIWLAGLYLDSRSHRARQIRNLCWRRTSYSYQIQAFESILQSEKMHLIPREVQSIDITFQTRQTWLEVLDRQPSHLTCGVRGATAPGERHQAQSQRSNCGSTKNLFDDRVVLMNIRH